MKRTTSTNPLKTSLMRGLHGTERQLDVDRQDIMLILLDLDTEEKIAQFMEWVLSKTVNGEPDEIVRVAC